MRFLRVALLTLALVSLTGVLLPATPSLAQPPTPLSPGCQAINGASGTANPVFTFGVNSFKKNEVIGLTVTGPGDNFVLNVDGTPSSTPSTMGGTIEYTVTADGNLTFEASVDGTITPTTPNTIASFTCGVETTPPDGLPTEGNVTLCHRPPGNPGNAHTITVGAPAVQAHLGHGDSLGACAEGEESDSPSEEGDLTFFVDRVDGELEIFGNCVQDVCELVIKIDLKTLTSGELVEGAEFTFDDDDDAVEAGDDPQDLDEDGDIDGDGLYVVIYYLGPKADDPTVKVFQVNLYRAEDDQLVDDSLLIFVNAEGKISFGRNP